MSLSPANGRGGQSVGTQGLPTTGQHCLKPNHSFVMLSTECTVSERRSAENVVRIYSMSQKKNWTEVT